MALKGLQSKINVLETVRQKVPGRRTGIDKRRPVPRTWQIDMGKSSSPRPAERK